MLLQFSEFSAGRPEDRNVGVGIFPEAQEILIGSTGGAGIPTQSLSAGLTEPAEGPGPTIDNHSPTVLNFLKLRKRLHPLLHCQIGLPAQIRRNHAGIAQISDELA